MISLDVRELAAVFGGGFLGAVARAGLEHLLPVPGGSWPWSTFALNLIGSALLGYLVTRLQERLPLSAYRRPFLGTGFCGALTTFSTFQVELLGIVRAGHLLLGVAYGLGSVLAGFFLLAAVTHLVRWGRVG